MGILWIERYGLPAAEGLSCLKATARPRMRPTHPLAKTQTDKRLRRMPPSPLSCFPRDDDAQALRRQQKEEMAALQKAASQKRQEADALMRASEQKRRDAHALMQEADAIEKTTALLPGKHADEQRYLKAKKKKNEEQLVAETQQQMPPTAPADEERARKDELKAERRALADAYAPACICCICENFYVPLERCARCMRWVCGGDECREEGGNDGGQAYCRLCAEALMADPRRRCAEAFRLGERVFANLQTQKCGEMVASRFVFLHRSRCGVCTPGGGGSIQKRKGAVRRKTFVLPRRSCIVVQREMQRETGA